MYILTENVCSSLKHKFKLQQKFYNSSASKAFWTPRRFPRSILKQRWCLKPGIRRDTLIRCPYAFPQLCLVERCGEGESTAGTNYSLSLNPRATYHSWAYNADRSLGTTANPGSAQLMTIGLPWQVPLQSGTSITCHENIGPLRWLHQQLLRVLDWEENQRDLIHLQLF